MKIVFFPSSCLPFHAHTLKKRPLGGLETAVIRLGEALVKLGHYVIVFSRFNSPPLSRPLYLPMSAVDSITEVDVLIAVREWKPLFLPIKAKRRFYWTGDAHDQMQNIGIGDKRVADRLDAMLAVSNWHREMMCLTSGLPLEKSALLPNGIYLNYFAGNEERKRKRLVYSSTPFRGLSLLPPIYLELKKIHPELELHVFSGYDVYAGPNGYNIQAENEYERLKETLQALPDCSVHGNVKQNELARELMKSAILVYPNTFDETSCITAMEAQAAGCVIVTSDKAALPETVGDAGILIEGTPGSEEYTRKFIEAVDNILSDDELFNKLSLNGLERAQKEFCWEKVACSFESLLNETLAQS